MGMYHNKYVIIHGSLSSEIDIVYKKATELVPFLVTPLMVIDHLHQFVIMACYDKDGTLEAENLQNKRNEIIQLAHTNGCSICEICEYDDNYYHIVRSTSDGGDLSISDFGKERGF